MDFATLPAPVTELPVPQFVNVTAVAAVRSCSLRAVWDSLPKTDQDVLVRGPYAEFGTLVHRAIERARRGDSDARDWFATATERRSRELARRELTAKYADLRSINSRRWPDAEQMIGEQFRPATRVPAGRSRTEPRRRGAEVELMSHRLRLRGRADDVSERNGSVIITDYKTGSAVDDQGLVKPEYELQLQAYALMLHEDEPDVALELVINDGEPRPVPSDSDALEAARQQVSEVLDGIPPAGDVIGGDLARPGEDCRNCSMRHRCLAYLDAAPQWWRGNEAPNSVPFDTWGRVVAIQGGERAIVDLEDAAGRSVRVRELDEPQRWTDLASDQHVWFFNAKPVAVRRARDGRRLHPRAFRDLPVQPADQRAWTLEVFVTSS